MYLIGTIQRLMRHEYGKKEKMKYKIIDKETYYRKGVFRHFSEDCKCSTSITARIDVTKLKEYSDRKCTKFYINFLYVLSKVLNSREDYRMGYLWHTDQPIINWGKYRQENETLMMPVTVRLNHAVADGYLVAKVFQLLEDEITQFCTDKEEI